jgi:hypothetical protein
MVFRNIVVAPRDIRNADLHKDHQMELFTNENGNFAEKHEERLRHQSTSKRSSYSPTVNQCEGLKEKNPLSRCSDH